MATVQTKLSGYINGTIYAIFKILTVIKNIYRCKNKICNTYVLVIIDKLSLCNFFKSTDYCIHYKLFLHVSNAFLITFNL